MQRLAGTGAHGTIIDPLPVSRTPTTWPSTSREAAAEDEPALDEQLCGPRAVPARSRAGHHQLAKFHTPEIVFGPEALAELGGCVLRVGGRRPFLVTDPGLSEAGWAAEARAHLRGAGVDPVVWTNVTPNPKDHEIEAAYEAYAASGSDVIVAVGGGSCIDAAKGVAILSGNGGRILGYAGLDQVIHPIPPLVMAPSTSGTGADVSQFAIVTDTTRHVKITIISRAIVPEISVIDPRLLTTMPDGLNAATGLDALTHAIESFVSRAHNRLTDHHALHAAHLVTTHLQHTMARPGCAGPRIGMAQAALEAGMAFTNAILGATHAMSHQVGGLLDAPHGVVNGVLLPHVIRFNAQADPERYRPLAAAVGIDVQARPADEVADALAEQVRALADAVGVPRGLSQLGVTEDVIPVLAKTTLDDACLTTNPRPAGCADIEALFRQAL